MSDQTLLEVRHLKKYFNTHAGLLHAVDDVSFDINRGETLGLVGESGCGKSTTGRVLLRLQEATAGQVVFEGQDIQQLNRKQMQEYRKKMQIVFQDPYSSLDPRRTVYESIEEPLRLFKVYDNAKDLEARIFELMRTVGLAERFVNSYPHELDGGRRQRVGVARALSLNPSFIVLDEPVSALDVSIQAQILNLIQELQEKMGITYLFISHNLSVVKHISSRIAVMYLGQIVEIADYKSIFYNPLHPYTQALLSAVPTIHSDPNQKHIILEGDVPSPVNPPNGCRFYPRCPHRHPECKDAAIGLREIESGHSVACHFPGGNN